MLALVSGMFLFGCQPQYAPYQDEYVPDIVEVIYEEPQVPFQVAVADAENGSLAAVWSVPFSERQIANTTEAFQPQVCMLNNCESLLPENFDPYQPISEQQSLSSGDVLEIFVYGHPDTLVNNVVVAPDGKLYYMFFDGIMASGRTIEEVKEEIREKAGELFVGPEISVVAKKLSGQNFLATLLEPQESHCVSPSYRLRIGDRLFVSVYGEANTERSLQVDRAGNINCPTVGEVFALGKTIDELRGDLNNGLKDHLRYALAAVTPIEFWGQHKEDLDLAQDDSTYIPSKGEYVTIAITQSPTKFKAKSASDDVAADAAGHSPDAGTCDGTHRFDRS